MKTRSEMKTILVVDNEPDIVEFTKTVLEMNGYKVVSSCGGEDCMRKLGEQKIDLVLLDIMMPGMSGWDVAAQIKGNPKLKNIPIIFLTVVSDTMSRGIGRLAAAEFIVKPFDKDIFLKRIDTLLDSSL